MLRLEITNYILSWKNTEGITEYDIMLCVKIYMYNIHLELYIIISGKLN